jgi:hypothetical protein
MDNRHPITRENAIKKILFKFVGKYGGKVPEKKKKDIISKCNDGLAEVLSEIIGGKWKVRDGEL